MPDRKQEGAAMAPEVTTYVTCLEPGSFYPEDSVREADGRDPERFARDAGASVFAFSYHDIASLVASVDGQPVPLSSRAIRKSPLYYVDADKLTVADVEALPGDHSILLANMRGNGWDVILRCRTGNFRPMEPGDVVISTRDAATGGAGPRGASFSNGPGGPRWPAEVPRPVTHWDFTEGRPAE